MAEEKNKKPEELQEEQLDGVSGGSFRDKFKDIINKSWDECLPHPNPTPPPAVNEFSKGYKGS